MALCTIRIFTVSGKLVTVIEHDGFQENSRESGLNAENTKGLQDHGNQTYGVS